MMSAFGPGGGGGMTSDLENMLQMVSTFLPFISFVYRYMPASGVNLGGCCLLQNVVWFCL